MSRASPFAGGLKLPQGHTVYELPGRLHSRALCNCVHCSSDKL
jgi:hypothetical protein